MSTSMRWLHLSDIEGRHETLRTAIPHITRVVEDEPLDLIVVTGELVNADMQGVETFRLVRDALAELRDRVNGDKAKPKFLVVPGEEDRVREQAKVAARAFERFFEDAALRDSFPTEKDMLKLAEDGYLPFWQMFSDLMPDVFPGRMPGDCSFTLSNGMRVGVVGLNSEFLAPAKRRGKKLRTVEPWQIEAVVRGKPEDFCAQHDAILVAFHAPLRVLDAHSSSALAKLVGERGIVLTGPSGDKAGFVDRDQIRSFPGRQLKDGFCFGEMRVVNGKVTRKIGTSDLQPSEPKPSSFEHSDAHEAPDSNRGPRTRLRRVLLRNFRGIETLDVQLSGDERSPLGGAWTCIAGINGVGKSTILQAIALAGMDALDIGQIWEEKRKRFCHWSGTHEPNWPIMGVESDLLGTGTGDALVLKSARSARFDEHTHAAETTIHLEWETQGEKRKRTVTIQRDGRVETHGHGLETLPLIVGYGATRNLSEDFPPTQEPLRREASPRLRRTLTLYYQLMQVAHAEVLLARNPDPRLRSIVSQIASKAFDKEFSIEMRGDELIFGGNAGLDALDLPDGFRSMLAWVADLAATWCEDETHSDDISAIEAIVLLDEIDLHLHPSLQRDLVPRLRRALPRVQWVVTTHAPLVLGSFHETELVPLDASVPGGIRHVDRPILGFSVDQIMQWLMGVSPVGGEVDRQIRRDANVPLDEGKLAEILEVSPDVSLEQAKANIAQDKELLARLRRGDL